MGTITLTLTDLELSILESYATIIKTDVEALVTSMGISQSINQALNNEVQYQVTSGTISLDITSELAKNPMYVQSQVNTLHQQGKTPQSIVDGLKARATKVK